LTAEQLAWEIARAAALSAFFAISASLVTGQALRSAVFEGALPNRDLLRLHQFLTLCWLPLVGIHIAAITLDGVARLSPLDWVLPFRVAYAPLAIGLGTVGFDLLLLVAVSSYLRPRIDAAAWRWLHRLSYLMFGAFALHGLLAGTDFARVVVLAPAAAVLVFVTVLSLARLAFGRLGPTAPPR
jgi:DMSO/TMAO reductase YedYZ heme-binding membrane subunit